MPLFPSQDELWAELRRDTFLIVGFSPLTGFAAAQLLERKGVRYKISDCASRSAIAPLLARLRVAEDDVFSGSQDPGQLQGITKVLLSPGVPRSIPLIAEALRRGIPVWTDIDFLYPFAAHKRFIAITGTDGKTTTTALTGELLRSVGPVVVAGNIGVPVLAAYDEILAANWVVLELSSFMLEELACFRPNLGALLNIGEDHVDRYPSLREYAEAKFNLVKHCGTENILVKNADDPILANFSPKNVSIRTFSKSDPSADSFYRDGMLHVLGWTFPRSECLLAGQQNTGNILVACTLAKEAGASPEAMAAVLRSFRGLPHRMEHVGCFGGIDVYNDSKATTVHAVDAALRNFPANVVLILGGRDKGLDFSGLRVHAPRLRRLIGYGECGEKLLGVLGLDNALYAYPFEEAVRLGAESCRPGDVLLLSPGCVSWDQYPNYEVRGEIFKRVARACLA